MITWMKKVNNFEIVIVQPQDIAYLFHIFCQFQPRLLITIAYTKNCVYINLNYHLIQEAGN